jgi:hypothetical protein
MNLLVPRAGSGCLTDFLCHFSQTSNLDSVSLSDRQEFAAVPSLDFRAGHNKESMILKINPESQGERRTNDVPSSPGRDSTADR